MTNEKDSRREFFKKLGFGLAGVIGLNDSSSKKEKSYFFRELKPKDVEIGDLVISDRWSWGFEHLFPSKVIKISKTEYSSRVYFEYKNYRGETETARFTNKPSPQLEMGHLIIIKERKDKIEILISKEQMKQIKKLDDPNWEKLEDPFKKRHGESRYKRREESRKMYGHSCV